ncbi:hypothetical protein AKJ47_00360 [candidate division MSBL1 archaeon SCGC-AAA261G05]|uniref:Large ribosomal subunit protein uL24 n=3 Tax=candidate division MSBL1 TaxID=215777 RepID=A0A133UZL8_9EURY|nr:hypothetical protein AKJ42_02795 [candidate division MSBL1 archaeon SCGC-AAA261C02]KXB04206.1 hypothetical protein AKJ47_00360 [candidate division MSBL1 archaeon SCGC-AAA261G05]KXB09365.1 hypothetical protein AKJ46_00475 [candidate division MSBL1 archaeon SCGC-AAA833K04]
MKVSKNRSVHKRNKSMAASLSAELREKHGCKSLPVRVGDKIRLERGDFKGMEGNVLEVDAKNNQIMVEGVEITKADESEVTQPVHPSNVVITSLEKDKERDNILARRSKGGKERTEQTPEEA